MSLSSGVRLGSYEILSKIGEGAVRLRSRLGLRANYGEIWP